MAQYSGHVLTDQCLIHTQLAHRLAQSGVGNELSWQLRQSKRRLQTKPNVCVGKRPPNLSVKVTEQHSIATPAFNTGLSTYITLMNMCKTLQMLRSGVESFAIEVLKVNGRKVEK